MLSQKNQIAKFRSWRIELCDSICELTGDVAPAKDENLKSEICSEVLSETSLSFVSRVVSEPVIVGQDLTTGSSLAGSHLVACILITGAHEQLSKLRNMSCIKIQYQGTPVLHAPSVVSRGAIDSLRRNR